MQKISKIDQHLVSLGPTSGLQPDLKEHGPFSWKGVLRKGL